MEITTDMVKTLREQCGAGIMDCRNALKSTGGDMEKALEILKEKGLLKAQKKAARATAAANSSVVFFPPRSGVRTRP